MEPKKSLGQHWLTDIEALEAIAEHAEIRSSDTVLEIGPGLGNLTRYLVRQARHVVAVEYDERLAKKLPNQLPAKNLSVVQADIRKFDLTSLPSHYKVVANIPYYLTSNLIKTLSEAVNPPAVMVLLVQQEVGERLCAKPGQMSLLAVSAQLYYDCELGTHVSADKFEPPPKVDSQVVVLTRHTKPIFPSLDTKLFFKIVKAGFSEKRKKLRSSLSGGLHMNRLEVERLLNKAGVSPDARAQELSLKDWHKLYLIWER